MRNLSFFKKFNTPLYNNLDLSQKKVLAYLTLATKITDRIFVKQITSDYFCYPKKVDKKIILEANKKNPPILSYYTLLKNNKNDIVSFRYEDYYQKELGEIAKYLIFAAKECGDLDFKKFLYQRAIHLIEGNYKESEKTWVLMKTDYPINIAIGPLLTYHDKLFGIKTYYSSCVYIRNLSKEKLYQKITKKIKKNFLENVFFPSDVTPRKEIIEVGDIYVYGGEIAKMKAVAWARPSNNTDCKDVLNKYGTKKLIFGNAIAERIKNYGVLVYKSLFNQSISLKDLIFYTQMGIFLHELGHGYAIYSTSKERLKDFFWFFEELKSDVFAIHLSPYLIEYKFISKKNYEFLIKGLITDIFSQYQLAKKVPERKGHAFSAKYLFFNFIKDKVFKKKNKVFEIDFEVLKKKSAIYLKEIQDVLANFSYDEALNFIKLIEEKFDKCKVYLKF
jgi:hypothetical protein